MGYLIVNGTKFQMDREIVHHPMPRPPSKYGIVARKKPPDFGVIHYTAAENPAATVLNTLVQRGLSIHFVIDREGVIHQSVDPGRWQCAHAGRRANRRSVGVEVVSYGWRDQRRPAPDPERPEYETEIHGWRTTMADFYECQYEALIDLCDALNHSLALPLEIPEGVNERLSDADLRVFCGWLGHYHVERLDKEHPKCDPGPAVFERLAREWGY